MSHPGLPRWLALCALAGIGLASAARAADTCAAPAVLLERFMSAECEACWKSGAEPKGAPLVLDWIVPSARGEDAPLAAAAVAEAASRVGAPAETQTRERWHALAARGAWSVEIEDGPAWNGYIAARLRVARQGGGGDVRAREVDLYIALVEQVRAGEEGTPVERMLVRSVAGPMLLDPASPSVTHLRAFRIPQGSRPARLTAIGWVQDASGVVLAAARVAPDEDCQPAR